MSGEVQRSADALAATVAKIAPLREMWTTRARAHLDVLTKPLGSLGRLEDLAAQVVAIREERWAEPLKKAVYVFAADHGVTEEGVSAYPREVTRQMVLNFLAEGAAVNVLARACGAEMHVVDVGVDAEFVDAEFEEARTLLHYKVRRGSRNMLHEAAMSDAELAQALEAGLTLAREAAERGVGLLAVGEMGIGNTTAASAITAALTGADPESVTGRGTGLTDAAHSHKREVIEGVLRRHSGELDAEGDALKILGSVGGLEIAAMTGMILGAAQHRIALVIDGFISTSAAAVAYAIAPGVREYLIAGHRSEEPGHRILLDYLRLEPVLSLGMRLGEGSGAVLAMPVIESAMKIYREMATFASAGVSEAIEGT